MGLAAAVVTVAGVALSPIVLAQDATDRSEALKGTSVWVTVQRRWVYLQGCVDSMSRKRALERIARSIPDGLDVFVDVTNDASKSLPYPPLDPSQRRQRGPGAR